MASCWCEKVVRCFCLFSYWSAFHKPCLSNTIFVIIKASSNTYLPHQPKYKSLHVYKNLALKESYQFHWLSASNRRVNFYFFICSLNILVRDFFLTLILMTVELVLCLVLLSLEGLIYNKCRYYYFMDALFISLTLIISFSFITSKLWYMLWDNGTDDMLNNRLMVSWTTLGETFSKAGDLTLNGQ